MAGQYFIDPRPLYFVTADQKYSLLDDCFPAGKKEGGSKFIDDVRKLTEKETAAAKNEKSTEAEKPKVEAKSKIQTIELNVDICCDNCEKKVKDALDSVRGVESVYCDQVNRKVHVKGSATKEVVLKKVKKLKPRSEVVEKK